MNLLLLLDIELNTFRFDIELFILKLLLLPLFPFYS